MTPRLEELKDLLKDDRASDDPTLVAYCDNYLFEERVLHQRQANYEKALQGQASNFDAWDLWHRDRYLPRAIYREIPETFTDLNASAAKYDAMDAQAALEDICASLNRNPHSVRPRFAGFFQDAADPIDQPDWANRVRDRFGLAHFDPKPGETMPVAFMSYPVRDLLQAVCKQIEAVHPVCVPTVLDHEFTACFLPAPRQLPYGHTLQLMGDPECEHKIAEVLHLRFAYRPEHIHKVGVVTEPVTALTDPGLDSLRADHLFCLQYESSRDDFGRLPTGWTDP